MKAHIITILCVDHEEIGLDGSAAYHTAIIRVWKGNHPSPERPRKDTMNAIINLVIPGADRFDEDDRFDDIEDAIVALGISEDEIELNISTTQSRGSVSTCRVYANRMGDESASAALTAIVRAHYPNSIW